MIDEGNMNLWQCSKCRISCSSQKAMQEHFASHFHTTNLARILKKDPIYTKEQYDEMISKSNFIQKVITQYPLLW